MSAAMAAPQTFQMPATSPGDIVHHFNTMEEWESYAKKRKDFRGTPAQPSAAMVMKVGDRSIALWVFPVNNPGGGYLKDGVRHVLDPDKPSHHIEKIGFWDHRPEHKEAAKLRAMVESLRQAVDELAKKK